MNNNGQTPKSRLNIIIIIKRADVFAEHSRARANAAVEMLASSPVRSAV